MSDPLVAVLVRCGLAGILAGWTAVAALLALDVGGLAALLLASDDRALALGLLLFGFGVTFGGAAMAAGVMQLGASAPDPARPAALRAQPPASTMRAAPVGAARRPRGVTER